MTIKQKVKELWKLCFDDSEEFTEMYFGLRYTNKVNLSIQSGDEIIAALQMFPYPMTFCNTAVQTSYISGACTHPEYRDRGVMKELLSQAFTQMTRRGVHISTLIPADPWLFDYYAKTGYVPVFNYSRQEIDTETIVANKDFEIKVTNDFDEGLYSFFERKMQERSCCIQHDREDFKVILEDMKLSKGHIFTAWNNGQIHAMAFTRPQNDKVEVTELLSEGEQPTNAVILNAAKHYGYNKVTLLTQPAGSSEPLGMARIIYAKAVLQFYAAANPEKEINIELTDDQLSLNNGYYYLVKGKCMTTKKRIPGQHLKLTIGELTQLILGPEKPYMSLMLN